MKNKSVVFIISVISILGLLVGCNNSSDISKEEYEALMSELEQLKSQQTNQENANSNNTVKQDIKASENKNDKDKKSQNEKIEMVKEYTLPDGIGWYTRHFIVVKNNSDETQKVNSSSIAYDKGKNVLGVNDASIQALGAGCTSIMCEAFDVEGLIDHYDTTISASKDKNYESVIQDLTVKQINIANGAVFQVTNNGSKPAEFVKGYALFIKDGELVSYDDIYFVDDDSELKEGATISKQMTTFEEFDSIEFYLTGRRY